ncbi:beta-lactamase family protein [Actinomadura sp. ATCC 31491]|uniref:Beta-lactamase family protein n=1 Tax=Actinomadura luzonensis TaxID=2805427 RepID=A0ABT0FS85_9ACTN|nr:serine hydrolase domain-containing protein [Actinomadura luzonensis]MCK2215201.1 beta-lactamase family protein [Actinomadura luzonensis]
MLHLIAGQALAVKAVTLITAIAVSATLPPQHDQSRAYDQADLQHDADAVRDAGVVGVQAQVVGPDGKSMIATSGVADLRTRRPVPANGYFRIGSNNKTFVATVILQLVSEGRLSLDDTVEQWLPGLVTGNGNDGGKMSVRDLLQHTSGIHDDYPYPTAIGSAKEYYQHRFDTFTPEQVVARAMRHQPDFAPGERWSYANTGYALLGMIIKRVTGRLWHQEVEDRIIRPLGLRHTLWPGRSAKVPQPHARGYDFYSAKGKPTDVTEHRDADASGGLISTTADLNRFFRALLGGKLLGRAELAQMRHTVPVDEQTDRIWPGARYGLGVFTRPLSCGGVSWGHGGDILGYMTRTGVSADGKLSVIVSMSSERKDSLDALLRQDKAAATLIDHVLCRKA